MDELIPYEEEQQGQASASEASEKSCTTSNEIMEILRKFLETQNSIHSELSQQKLEILEIEESQNQFQEKIAEQLKSIFQLQVYIEKLSSVVCDGKRVKTNPHEGFMELENKKDLDDFNQRIRSDKDYKVKIY